MDNHGLIINDLSLKRDLSEIANAAFYKLIMSLKNEKLVEIQVNNVHFIKKQNVIDRMRPITVKDRMRSKSLLCFKVKHEEFLNYFWNTNLLWC